eukprot:299053-Rhodomonas_salina.2
MARATFLSYTRRQDDTAGYTDAGATKQARAANGRGAYIMNDQLAKLRPSAGLSELQTNALDVRPRCCWHRR